MRIYGTAFLALALIGQASASLTQVFTRAALGGTDHIDWSAQGPIADPLFGMTFNGHAFKATGGYQYFTEGGSGGFTLGDVTLVGNEPTTITYGASQKSVGMQIQSNAFGLFDAELDAYDNLNNWLGTVFVSGDNEGGALNTNPFLGVTSTSIDIAKVVLSTTNGDFGLIINQVDSDCGCGAVPEPASMAALGMGVLAIVRRKRKA